MKGRQRREIRIAVEVLMAIALLIGACQIEMTSIKICETAVKLAIINDNVRLYNEQPFKSDKMTAEYNELKNLRNEEFYNSEDDLVKFFSNAHLLFKLILIVISVVLMFVTPIAVIIQFCIYYAYKNELQRQKRMCKKLKRQLEEFSNKEN